MTTLALVPRPERPVARSEKIFLPRYDAAHPGKEIGKHHYQPVVQRQEAETSYVDYVYINGKETKMPRHINAAIPDELRGEMEAAGFNWRCRHYKICIKKDPEYVHLRAEAFGYVEGVRLREVSYLDLDTGAVFNLTPKRLHMCEVKGIMERILVVGDDDRQFVMYLVPDSEMNDDIRNSDHFFRDTEPMRRLHREDNESNNELAQLDSSIVPPAMEDRERPKELEMPQITDREIYESTKSWIQEGDKWAFGKWRDDMLSRVDKAMLLPELERKCLKDYLPKLKGIPDENEHLWTVMRGFLEQWEKREQELNAPKKNLVIRLLASVFG